MKEQSCAIDESSVATETVRCALCGSDKREALVRSRDIKQYGTREYEVVRCGRCGLAYLNPRPTRGSILAYYGGDDPEKTARKPALYERLYFALFRKIPLRKKGAVLDVGCGCGRYIYTLKSKGWDVKGLDIGHVEYGRAVLGLDIREGDLSQAHFEPESFDAITFWWSFEHMHDPEGVLREARRILKKGGMIIIAVHNIASLEARLFGGHWFHLFLPKHLYHYSPDTLTKMLQKSGFMNVRVRHDPFSFGAIGSLQCLLNTKGIDVSFTNPLFYALSLPLDIILSLMRTSGLITAYAIKK